MKEIGELQSENKFLSGMFCVAINLQLLEFSH